MGNRKLEHRRSHVNIAPPIVFKVTIVETWKQHIGVRITQSFDVSITTITMEMVVTLSIVVIKKGKLIRSIAKLGSRLGGI